MIPNRLLIADDEPDLCEFVRELAGDLGFDALSATRFEEIEFAVRDFKPAMILLDLAMPDHDGVEILRFLADAHCEAGIVLVSGFDARVLNAAERFGRELGLRMLGSLQKPIRLEDLEAVLRSGRHGSSGAPTLAEMRGALEREELLVHWQPRVSLPSGALMGFEALVRWQHPTRGLVMPDAFVPAFEAADLIAPLTEMVATTALRQSGRWVCDGLVSSVAVNLSARLLRERSYTDQLHEWVKTAGVDPAQVTFEITESTAMEDPVCVTEVLSRLRLKGYRVALDDFGTGHSSLVTLHRMPFSELKVDKSFVFELGRVSESEVIVRSVIGLAHNLGLEVCAEGVETHAAWAMLCELGSDFAQGYWISRPIPAEEIPHWTERWSAQHR